ncbi:MAG TPA: hypothetical protein VLG37_02595 [Candidatus Saccharimonadales bacterium]|nr:hypothetical protein [Candidatus Saccharimonadales bacterium]
MSVFELLEGNVLETGHRRACPPQIGDQTLAVSGVETDVTDEICGREVAATDLTDTSRPIESATTWIGDK